MANVVRPHGFVPYRHMLGSQIQANAYPFTVGSGTAMARGDVVKVLADGTVATAAAGDGVACVGVCAGVIYTDTNNLVHYSDYMPADTTGYTDVTVFVYDDPYIVFEVSCDSTGLAATDVNATVNHIATAPDATRPLSQQTLDHSVNSTYLQFLVLGLNPVPNNAWGANASVLVAFNQHRSKASVVGV